MKKHLLLLLMGILFGSSLGFADATPTPPSPKSWLFREMAMMPVQSNGRIKPFESFAEEIVLFETGSRKFEGWNPVDLMLSWIAEPGKWQQHPMIQVNRGDVKRQLGIDESRRRFSPGELLKNPTVAQYIEHMGELSQPPDPKGAMRVNPREQELKRVFDRLGVFTSVVSGKAWLVVPKNPPAAWLSLADKVPEGEDIRKGFVTLLISYQANDSSKFQESAAAVRKLVESKITDWTAGEKHTVQAEYIYDQARPFLYAWVLYLVAGLFWIFALSELVGEGFRGISRKMAFTTTGLAITCHAGGLLLRCYIAGRPPVTNMYESIIWVSLGSVVFATIIYFLQRNAITLAVSCFLATLLLVAADGAPAILDPGINPLVPVLRSNYWLTIHVLTITLGYAAFALTLGLSNVTLYHFIKGSPGSKAKIFTMNNLTYRAMQFGVVLLAAGTILGGVWADYSWGRFWGWDPKEVWALIALLCYLAILHGRYAQWVGQFGYAAWSIVSFLSVLMAWYGVNFILGVGLHSYGFSTGGLMWISGFVAIQLIYVSIAAVIHSKRQKQLSVLVAGSRPQSQVG